MPAQAMTRRRNRLTAGVLGSLTIGGLLLASAPAPGAAAAPLVKFRAVAGADGVRQTLTRPDAPLSSQVADSGVPSAQAAIDGLGNSEAYGSLVYPGASALAVPGLASGIIGQSLPSYPLLASSSDPSRPKDDASKGPAEIRAASTASRSAGNTSFVSPSGGRFVADAEVTGDQAAGTLSAVGKSEASAVDIAGVLRLSSVRGSATAKLAGGKVTTSSTLEVGETSVAGIRVVLTADGLELAGQKAPLPDTSPILKPLKDAGLTVELVAPEKLNGGVRSAGVRVSDTQATPDGSTVTQSYTFGQALAVVSATSDDDVATPSSLPPDPVAPAPAGGPLAAGQPPGAPQTSVGGTDVAPTQPNQAPAVAGPVNTVPVALGSAPFTRMSTLSFYLVLVLAGAVAVASHKMLRRFGVSATWTS
jgi:hypothetical protein